MTLRNRIAAAAAVGVLIVLAAVSTVLYLLYAANLRSRVDADLVDAAQQASSLAQQIKQSARENGTVDISRPVRVGSTEVQLLPGPVAAGQPNRFGSLSSRDVAVAEHVRPAYFADVRADGRSFRIYTAAMPDASTGALVRISRAADADDGALRDTALLLAALTVAAAGITYLLARLAAGRVLRPIGQLTAAAEHVTQTGDLGARLGATARDEVGRLGATFDTMLAALRDSIAAQRSLVADASHELRTPLTSLTTNLELLEDGSGLRDPEAPALVRAAREQAGELDALVADLLDLARYGESPPHREVVRLDLIADAAVRRRTPAPSDVEIRLEARPSLAAVDPAAVDRAIGNLIDNAVKWSPAGALVRVLVADGQVSVVDQGPGIADEDVPHVFERFYRSPAARGRPGAGLGLAIVGQVVAANGGTVHLDTGPDGSTFMLRFPPAG